MEDSIIKEKLIKDSLEPVSIEVTKKNSYIYWINNNPIIKMS